MEIFPAIDLKNGQCVRLTQGNFDAIKIYEADPLAQARRFADAGATWLHVVDLDGARDGDMRQFDLLAKLVEQTPLKVQIGGGIRSDATIEKLLNAGAERIVIGSLAVENKLLVQDWLCRFGPDRLVLAFDVRLADNQPEILTQGWQSGSRQRLWDILESYKGSGLKNILCTDVDRDGMLSGANHTLYQAIQKRWPELNILASGGVSSLDELLDLAKLNIAGAIVGKAIYEGRLDLTESLKRMKHAR